MDLFHHLQADGLQISLYFQFEASSFHPLEAEKQQQFALQTLALYIETLNYVAAWASQPTHALS